MIWPLCFWISMRRDVKKARFNNKAQVGVSKLLTGRIWSNGWSVMEQCKMRVNFVNVTLFLVYIGATAILGTKLATACKQFLFCITYIMIWPDLYPTEDRRKGNSFSTLLQISIMF